MFDDPKKELRRMEQQLLADDDGWLDNELAEAHRLLGDEPEEDVAFPDGEEDDGGQPPIRNYANGYGAGAPRARVRNTAPADVDLEEYSDAVHDEPREKGVKGLVILAVLELLGILAVLAYWFLVLL